MQRYDTELGALRERIAAVAADLPGRLGVSIHYLDVHAEVRVASDDLFPAASVIKIPIMVEAYRQAAAGLLPLDEPLPVLPEEVTDGSGILKYLHTGLPLTVADAIELMIVVSDNTATNLLLRRLGTDAVNGTMRDLGLLHTRTAGPIRTANAPLGLAEMSHTTPQEMATLLEEIARGRLIDAEASAAMLQTLEHQLYADMIPRYLPFTYYPERLGLAEMPVRVAHKTGGLSGVRNDAGIVIVQTPSGARTMVISAFTADLADDELWTVENVGARAVATIARLAYETLLRLVTPRA
ncbi:MAG TPA: serine hydrolase [Chloroflexota bacterium]|nr:serine hydrolase [Chloroflexota bacterium]